MKIRMLGLALILATLSPVALAGNTQELQQAEKAFYLGQYDKALPTIQAFANQGNSQAQNNLGYMYEHGNGVAQNTSKAVEWYTKSANQGNVQAQINLGSMYHEGHGVKQDNQLAMQWYTKASNQGSDVAQFNLGVMYFNQDKNKAHELFMQSAKQGFTPAKQVLAQYFN